VVTSTPQLAVVPSHVKRTAIYHLVLVTLTTVKSNGLPDLYRSGTILLALLETS